MSFIEFLLEYYIYILAVLIILIVGVIGFLVDSKNKEKKNIVTTDNTNSNGNIGSQVNNVNSNVSGAESVQGANTLNSNATLNEMISSSFNPNSNMSVVSNNLNDNVVSNIQNVQPSMPNEVSNNMQSVMSNEEINNGQTITPVMSSMAVNQEQVMNSNLNNTLVNNQVDNMENGIQSVGAFVANAEMSQSQVMTNVNPMDANSRLVQDNVMGINNMQAAMSNVAVNPMPTHAVPPQVNVGVNEVLGAFVNQENNMSSYQQNVRDGMVSNQVNLVSSNGQVSNQTQGMGFLNNMQGQSGVGVNQATLYNNVQIGGGTSMQSTDLAGDVNNIQGNSNVVTSDGAKPFDISSMFVNNQQ